MTHRQTLIPLGDVAVNDLDQTQTTDHGPSRRHATKRNHPHRPGFDRFTQALDRADDLLGWSQVLLHDQPGLAVDPLTRHGVVIGPSLNGPPGNRGHSYIIPWLDSGSRTILTICARFLKTG